MYIMVLYNIKNNKKDKKGECRCRVLDLTRTISSWRKKQKKKKKSEINCGRSGI